jgi:hypothetical protein
VFWGRTNNVQFCSFYFTYFNEMEKWMKERDVRGYCNSIGCRVLINGDCGVLSVPTYERMGCSQGCSLLRSVLRLLVTANVVPSSTILLTLVMDAIRSSKTWTFTRATRRHIPEDSILHGHGHRLDSVAET